MMIRFLCLASVLLVPTVSIGADYIDAIAAKAQAETAKTEYQAKAQSVSYTDQSYYNAGMQESYLWGQRDGRAKSRGGQIFWLTAAEWTTLTDATGGALAWPHTDVAADVSAANTDMALGDQSINNNDYTAAVLAFNLAKGEWDEAKDKETANLGFITAIKTLFDSQILALHLRYNAF